MPWITQDDIERWRRYREEAAQLDKDANHG